MILKIVWGMTVVLWLVSIIGQWRDEHRRELGVVLLALVLVGLTACTAEVDKDGARAYNPEQQARATAIAQQARDDAAKRELERQALQAKVETEVKAQAAAAVSKSVYYLAVWTGAGVGVLVLCIGLAFGLVAWVGKRATTIYPNKQGQYPIIERRGFGWVVLHDPSRQVGPGAVYRVPTLADVITERLKLPGASAAYPLPDVSEQSLLAVSSQSNAVALTSAANRWPKLPQVVGRSVMMRDGAQDVPVLPQGDAMTPVTLLPSRVPLRGLLAGQAPSLSRLMLGVGTDSAGQVAPVTGDLGQMVHVLAAGGSGWGKSQFMRMMVYQLATASEPCALVLADMERVTFGAFGKSDRLMFPIVDTEKDLGAVLVELSRELDRRKAIFAKFPEVDNLTAYNARAPEHLPPLVLAIDEATNFLKDGAVAEGIKTLAQRGRKYGVWLMLGGQTFSSKDVDTATSLQFSSRVQFRAPVKSAAQTLVDDKEAKALECPGRAILVLPGKDAVKVQVPTIGYDDIVAALEGRSGPQRPMPAPIAQTDDAGHADDLDAQIRLLAGDGLSKTEICRKLFGTAGGTAWYRVTRAIEESLGASSSSVDAEEEG